MVSTGAMPDASRPPPTRSVVATGARVATVVADLCTEDGRRALLAACPDPDILVNNNGGPPPGRFEDWDHARWLAALEANLLAPVLLIRARDRRACAPAASAAS